MPNSQFVHLHNHTEYSLLDGACRIVNDKGGPSELIKFVSSYKMPALAITDHGNMSGAIEFYSTCINEGIKPIVGCEVYVTDKTRILDKSKPETIGKTFHLTLLSKDLEGYNNLMRLVSIGFLEGFYYKPRVDYEVLRKYSKGLICLTGCLHGQIPEALASGNKELAYDLLDKYKDIFGAENVYIEIMDNGMVEQRAVLPKLIELANKTETPIVATNDCHYLHKEDAYTSHDALLCIGTGKKLDDPTRLKFSTNQFYYKLPEEMMKVFSAYPEAIKNTIRIAEKCNLRLSFDQTYLPHYEVPKGETADTYLRKLCEAGLKKRYKEVTSAIQARLDFELSVISKMGFSQYFLIVNDFVQYAKNNGVPVGPGRGSGAGAIVSYSLGITDICPLKYGLLFERFLNPDRKTMPDLDIDFADYGRDKVIKYVRNKYGEKNVAQIITFGTMQARLVVRDVARVMGFAVADGDRIAKLIPQGSTLYQSITNVKELKDIYNSDEGIRRMIDISMKLEGLKRHQGVHAAGLVIAKDEITKFAPLIRATRKTIGDEEVVTTQYNDDALIKLGMLKMDFLGLRTLTIIEEAQKLINANKDKNFDLSLVPLDDKNTFKLLQEARTSGVFQLESSGMKDLLRKLKPTIFEDIIALVSLYRPGPMGSGMIDDFVSRKHQKTKIKYDHPCLEPILKDTYGVIVYQEQVMQIAIKLAGFTAGQADVLRKAMGKKIPEEMAKLEVSFMEGAHKNSVDKKISKKTWDLMVHFGGYGFNKSHAAAYGLLAYRTAYLKANYPLEYTCALLISEIGRSSLAKEEGSRLVSYIQEAKESGIEVLPPDVLKSDMPFTVEGEKIRFGLLAIKNVGEMAVKEIIEQRRKSGPYKSLQDFCMRVDTRQVNKKVIESLIKAGAFDFTGLKDKISLPSYVRAKAIDQLEELLERRNKMVQGQDTLFEIAVNENKDVPPWADHVVLGYEREVLGFYFSGHPLAQYKKTIDAATTHTMETLPQDPNELIVLAGMITTIKRLSVKKTNEQMAKFNLENFEGSVEVIVFPKTYAQFNRFVVNQSLVVVKGRISTRDEKPTLIADELIPLEKFEVKAKKEMNEIYLRFTSAGVDDDFIKRLKTNLEKHKGNTKVFFKVKSHANQDVLIETPLKVTVNDKLFADLKSLLGENSWEVH
ncbi:MAG: DNA polymerase III subunit alpha [Elusimicrobia bacterium RIFOXYA2_FULL_39_19]|nr:MAG: DNA polymerase III subunit alpha [Elusimicrobia bacterium RIFOXYA2_FULL_39_19]